MIREQFIELTRLKFVKFHHAEVYSFLFMALYSLYVTLKKNITHTYTRICGRVNVGKEVGGNVFRIIIM